MATVTVTAQIGTTCHYTFTPEPSWSTVGQGVNVLDTVRGFINEVADQTPVTLTAVLDPSVKWDVRMSFLGAPPVEFEGLDVTGGGDLFTLLSDQGWNPGVSVNAIPLIIDGGGA